MPTANYLGTAWLSETVKNVYAPISFLRKGYFRQTETVPHETIEIGRIRDEREVAPMSLPQASAIEFGSISRSIENITAPNVKVKGSVNPGDLYHRRKPGEPVHQGMPVNALRERVVEILGKLESGIANLEEYMSSQAMVGVLSYSVEGQDSFILNYGRPAGHTASLGATTYWNVATAFPEKDFATAVRTVAQEESVGITDAIMSPSAADAFVQNPEVLKRLDARNYNIGQIDLTRPYLEDGSLRFLGNFAGLRCWVYHHSLTVNGSLVPMIRDKFVEFVNLSASNGAKFMYGAIPDFEAIRRGIHVARRFSKSWESKELSNHTVMLQSRPLPTLRRPGTHYSLQVIA